MKQRLQQHVSLMLISLFLLLPKFCLGFDTASFSPVDTNYPIPAGAIFVSPTGTDANAGTDVSSPSSLSTAVSKVPSGGTIVLRGGLYYAVDMGKVTKPIKMQPYPHEKVYLLGSTTVTGFVADGTMWKVPWTNPLPDVACPAEAIDSAYPNACKPEQVFISSVPLTQVGTKAAVVGGKFFMDEANSLLYVGTSPVGKLVEVSVKTRALQFDPGAEGSVVKAICFAHYSSYWKDISAAVVSDAAGVRFESNLFVQNAGTGLAVFKPNHVLVSNYIGHNGYRGMNGNRCDGTQIVGNTVEFNNLEHFNINSCDGSCTVAGIKVAHTDNLLVHYNTFRQNVGTGFWCDLGCTDATITKNMVSLNQKHGIYYEVSSRAIVASNVIAYNWVNGIKVSGSDQVRIYNNDFISNGYGIGLYDDTRSPSTDDYSAGLGLTWNTAGTVIRNNLFSNSGNSNSPLYSTASTQVNSAQMVSAMDHNGWYRKSSTTPAALIHWCPPTCADYASHAAFVSATGLDAAPPSIVVDNTATNPFFVNEAGGDYNLLSTSPAQSAGAALPADIAAALAVPVSPVDMGALDWKGKGSAPPPPPPASSLSFAATDDATIKQDTPTTGYGADPDLIADTEPRQDFLLKFTVSGVSGRTVTKATVVLVATDPGAAGAKVHLAQHNNWNQATVTWNSAPWIISPEVDVLPAIVGSTTYSVDVTTAVTGDGTFSFRVIHTSAEGIRFASLEATDAAKRPKLTVDLQ